MNARVYLNTSTNAATSSIAGGGFTPPPVRAYSDVIVRFRLAREIEGEPVPDPRPIESVTARIGYQDAAPTSGTVTLSISVGGDTVTTAPVAYNATAAALKAALDTALDDSALDALQPVTVDAVDEGYRIVFADADETVTIAAATNRLWPLSFVNADRIDFAGGWATILGYRQTPVAEVASATATVADVPTVAREQAGSTTDGVAINEVQRIALDPGYAGGTWRLVWDGVKGSILPGFPTVEQLQESLDGLAPAGGIFNLIAVEDGVLVEFAGSMSGEGQELMTTEEFTAPPTEYVVVLPTATAAMRTLMAGAGTDNEVELPLDITVRVEDEDAPEDEATHVFPFALTFTKPVSDDSRNVSAPLDWTQPLSRTNNLAFSPDSLLVGNRAIRKIIGDGAATSFVVNHNLGSLSGTFTADASTDVCTKSAHNLHNGDPVTVSSSGTLPGGLTAGVTYYVGSATADTFKLAATPGGSAQDISSAGTGTHTVTVADGTTDVVFVEVWETGGLKRRVSPEDYTVAIASADAVTVSGFASTPTSGQYAVVMQTAGRPATYQAHTHAIAEVTGLQAQLDALSAAIAALQAGNFGGAAPAIATTSGMIDTPLPSVWRIPRSRSLPEVPASLLGWNPFAEGSTLRDLRLLPAVHVASGSIEALPATLPAPSSDYRDRVFYSATDRTEITGGLLAGQYAACDGRDWYRVRRETDAETTWYPTLFEMEMFRLSISPDELALRTRFDLAAGIEMALFDPSRRPEDRRTVARMSLILERGVRVSDSSPATTGSNIAEHFGSPVVIGRLDFDLTSVPVRKKISVSVARAGDGTLTAHVGKMLSAPVAVSAPASADFALRLRIARMDFQNLPEDGRGVLAVRGLNVGLNGRIDDTLGRWTIA